MDLLRYDAQDQLIGRRAFILGAASIAAAAPAARAAAKFSDAVGFRLRKKSEKGALRRLTFESAGHAWILDAGLFAGNPQLTLERAGKSSTVTFSGARFPGTQTAFEFRASIEPALFGHTVTFTFPGGLKLHGDFEKWIRGEKRLSCPIDAPHLQLLVPSLGRHASLAVFGDGRLEYTAANALVIHAPTALNLDGSTFPLRELALSACARSERTLVSGKTKSHTVLEAVGSEPWMGDLAIQTQEQWHVEGDIGGFRDLLMEFHDDAGAALVMGAAGKSGLKVHIPGQVQFELENARLARMIGAGDEMTLLADVSDEPAWLHTPGLSVEIAPKPGAEFRVRTGDGGTFCGAPQFHALRVAPTLEDAVVSIPASEPMDLEITVQARPPAKPISPVIQRPILKPVPTPIQQVRQPGIIAVAVSVFIVDIARRLDMIALRYQFVNLQLGSNGTASSLTRIDESKAAYIIVTFPPQSLAETTFDEDTTHRDLPAGFKAPIETRMAGPSRLVFFIPSTIASIPFSLTADGGLLDWTNWRQAVVATAKSSYDNIVLQPGWKDPLQIAPVNAHPIISVQPKPLLLARPFVPDESSEPAQLQRTKPFQRSGPEFPSAQTGVIAKNIDPTRFAEVVPDKRIKLNGQDTAIEMPAWLFISPNENARWFHATSPVTFGNKTELWHTRLGSQIPGAQAKPIETSDDGKWYYAKGDQDTGPFRTDVDYRPTIRAVDSVDYDDFTVEVVYNPPMDHIHRIHLVNSMTPRARGKTDSRPFVVERLMLTALGGYLKGEWNWAKGTRYNGETQTPETIAWRHVATLGRDHFVKLVDRGFLFPSGHKAVLITISERKFNRANGGIYAVLRKRQYIEVIDPVVDPTSAAEERKLGFQSLTCLTRVTPDIDMTVSARDIPGVADGDAFWVMVGGKQFLFNMRGLDMDGQTANWNQSAIFVLWHAAVDAGATMAKIITAHQTKTPPGNGTIAHPLDGHQVSFVPSDPKASAGSGGSRFPCQTLSLSGAAGIPNEFDVVPNFRPILHRASIRIPAVEQLQGKSPGPTASLDELAIEYAPGWTETAAMNAALTYYDDPDLLGDVEVMFADIYKQNGFGGPNTAEAFFEFLDKQHAKFKDTSKSGGVVNPNIGMMGLSRIKGPISGKAGQIGQTLVDASDYFPSVKALMFGAVNLWDLLPKKIDIGGNGTDSPKLVIESLYNDGKNKPPTDIKTSLYWMPKLSNWAFPGTTNSIFKVDDEVANGFKASDVFGPWNTQDSVLDAGQDTQLNQAKQHMLLKAEINVSIKSGSSSFKLLGEIRRFRIDCIAPASFIWLDFRLVRFVYLAGGEPKIQVDMPATTFTGPLGFVQTLQDLLSPGGSGTLLSNVDENALVYDSGWGFKPFCDVSLEGVKAGFTLTVPDITVGILAIRNISLGATLNLPFLIDPLRVRFNFCERNNPFALSVWGITGGGFISIALGVDGVECFEGSLEFGGSLSLDVGVASGSVSIMAGIYFKIDSVDGTTLTGYIRLDGSLNILGIIEVSLEFYLALTYHKTVSGQTTLTGTATMSVSISILFFSISVSVTVTKEIAGSGSMLYASTNGALEPPSSVPIPFHEAIEEDQWNVYCAAFGAH